MSQVFTKIINRLVDFENVYRNRFIEEVPKEMTKAVPAAEEIAVAIHEKRLGEVQRSGGQTSDIWESKAPEEKLEALQRMLSSNETRERQMSERIELLDEKAMEEELSHSDALIFTKTLDELSSLSTGQEKLKGMIKDLEPFIAQQ